MEIVQIPSKTYKLNEEVVTNEVTIGEPTIAECRDDWSGTYVVIEKTDALNGYPLKVLQLKGNTENQYNIYGNYPTPTTPVPVPNVRGSMLFKVSGKLLGRNLYDKSERYVGKKKLNNAGTGYANSTKDAYTYIDCKPNTTYTIQKTGGGTFSVACGRYTGSNYQECITDNEASSITITTSSDARFLIVFFYHTDGTYSASDVQAVVDTIQIEYGTFASPYEPYNVELQQVQVDLGSIELCKIANDSRTYNYYDYLFNSNGKWYKHKVIEKTKLKGVETWNVANGVFYCSSISNYTRDTFAPLSDNYIGVRNVESTSSMSHDYTIAFGNSNSADRLFVKDSRFSSVYDFTTWLRSNYVTIYYVLKNPVDEEITNATLISQLDKLLELQSYSEQMNIYTFIPNEFSSTTDYVHPLIEISYYTKDNIEVKSAIVDTIDGYIDNKDAMKQAIYHMLRTERYDYIIYSDNYGVELRQYIGESFAYLKNTIEQTLRDALTYDLRIKDVKVTDVSQTDTDKALVEFIAYTIYGDLQLEVSVVV